MEKDLTLPDIILKAEDIEWIPFSLPGWTGTTTAAFPNMNITKAPFIAMAKLAPDAFIQKHYHNIAIESVYVVEGELINNGETLKAGSFLVHGTGVAHGPHTTKTGCTLMFIQYPGVTVEDSVLVE
ncbi:MAG: cupin domain-containing protein [Ferruginibacter sp.]|nr:cupin domain-containing protein [Ferruginibacter sp.]